MCRISYLPSKLNNKKEKLTEFLTTLERAMGGDGNGIGYVINNNMFVYKGINLSIESIIERMEKVQPDNGFLFHTRLASLGGINYENTHPHKTSLLLLVHNGHWSHYINYPEFNQKIITTKKITIDVSDSTNSIKSLFSRKRKHPKKKKITKKVTIETYKYSDSYVMAQVITNKIKDKLKEGQDLESATDEVVTWLYDTLNYDAVIFQLKTGLTYLVTSKSVEVGNIGDAIVIGSQSLSLLDADNVKDFRGIMKIYNINKGEYKILKEEKPYYYDYWLKHYSYYHYYDDYYSYHYYDDYYYHYYDKKDEGEMKDNEEKGEGEEK